MASKMKVALLQFKWTDGWDGSFSRVLIMIRKLPKKKQRLYLDIFTLFAIDLLCDIDIVVARLSEEKLNIEET